jgi:ATP-dependent Clp protease ATP-binding subunit ClpA/ActR/RegA family two-component response regulator
MTADLAALLSSRVVGQPSALQYIVPSIHLYLSGLAPEDRPVGVFLLLGPTGTGKTRTVEALAEALHGDQRKILRLDCGEFQSDHEIAKLIGAPPGYVGHGESKAWLTSGRLAEAMSPECGLALVLFDEIEKAAPAMIQLLLGVLDHATLRLGDGSSVDFTDTLIFLTSNLGAREMMQEIQPRIGFASGEHRRPEQLDESLERIGLRAVKKHFSPEFVNRIDAVVTYRPLSRESLVEILAQNVAELQERVNTRLGHRSFRIEVAAAAQDFMIERGTSPEYGARELRRVIHRYLTQPLAAKVANREVPRGCVVTVDLGEDGESLMLRPSAGTGEAGGVAELVLVVDDNADILGWMQRVLTGEGLRVLPAASVEEARKAVRGATPDLAVLDYVLPDGDGVALAIELLEESPAMAILMISGMSLEEEDELVLKRREIPLLPKPFLSEELVRSLRSIATLPRKAKARGA